MAHPLDGAHAKLEWANAHVLKLQQELFAFFHRVPYTVWRERNRRTGQIRLLAQDMGVGDPPVSFALLAGEAAYQLRSSLDHVIYQLFLANQTTPDRKTQFPIFETSQGYKIRANAMIHGASVTAQARIEALQPYHHARNAQQDPLWMLQDLNNTDKHRLIPTCIVSGHHFIRVVFPKKELVDVEFPFNGPIQDGTELCRFVLARQRLEVEMESELFGAIAFQQIGGAQYEPVVPGLSQLANYVKGVIDSFASEFS